MLNCARGNITQPSLSFYRCEPHKILFLFACLVITRKLLTFSNYFPPKLYSGLMRFSKCHHVILLSQFLTVVDNGDNIDAKCLPTGSILVYKASFSVRILHNNSISIDIFLFFFSLSFIEYCLVEFFLFWP